MWTRHPRRNSSVVGRGPSDFAEALAEEVAAIVLQHPPVRSVLHQPRPEAPCQPLTSVTKFSLPRVAGLEDRRIGSPRGAAASRHAPQTYLQPTARSQRHLGLVKVL